MPRLTYRMMGCVFFLFGHNRNGTISKIPKGTGFFVGRHSRELPHLWHVYAVSNRHVVCNNPLIRINTKNGATRLFDHNPDQWILSDTDDLAILDVTDDLVFDAENLSWSDQFTWVNELDLLGHHSSMNRAYVGDQTIMIGLFADHAGPGKINLPVARFGNLAAIAHDDVPVRIGPGDLFARPAFLNDTRSRTGFSGSPVWAWYDPENDVRYLEDSKNRSSTILSRAKRPSDLCLIGVHRGQFLEDASVIKSNNKSKLNADDIVEIASSMTIVVPSWEINKMLEAEKFELQRKKRDEREDRKKASSLYQRLARAQERIIPPPPYK